ncbi:hypothetical protein A45J_2425 [hot springs metagenome]|uniref:Uncharacterized protein n=1 Tax=hot springs metagenome TaxID=433727 RepID=A0A5J4L701_9ZZZZ
MWNVDLSGIMGDVTPVGLALLGIAAAITGYRVVKSLLRR